MKEDVAIPHGTIPDDTDDPPLAGDPPAPEEETDEALQEVMQKAYEDARKRAESRGRKTK